MQVPSLRRSAPGFSYRELICDRVMKFSMMLKAAGLAYGGLLLSAGVAAAAPASVVALDALRSVCMPASERSIAPRDLALQAGYVRDPRAPAGLQSVLPLAALSASFSAPAEGGEVHVLSTVVPPPATPYSCAVAVSADVPELPSSVEAHLIAAGYRPTSRPSDDRVKRLDYQRVVGGEVDRVIGMFNLKPEPGQGTALLVAYRVDGRQPTRPLPTSP